MKLHEVFQPVLPIEIWEKLLDLLDRESLLSFQDVCLEWRKIVLAYIMSGRLGSRALVSYCDFISKTGALKGDIFQGS